MRDYFHTHYTNIFHIVILNYHLSDFLKNCLSEVISEDDETLYSILKPFLFVILT